MPKSNRWLRRRRRESFTPPQTSRENPQTGIQPSPKLPHEHDESAPSQDGGPHEEIKQARDDINRGIVDTDRRSAYGCGEDKGLQPSSKQRPQP